MARYRIVRDRYAGYEVQYRRFWWFPFWVMPLVNTHRSVEIAEAWARDHASHAFHVVKYLGELPPHAAR